ncbi:conserved hypothetical protein [Syntrophobacter sp. SbD1]|nr:conserved hypothetical protein [Syntrophobacter sp. SbD1]
MNEVISKLQQEAQRIASKHPLAEFYTRFKAQIAISRRLFYNHREAVRLREMLGPGYNEALGHGLFHSTRVSIDCATLIHIETGGDRMKPIAVERLMLIGIYAGLLHDICRDEQNHAKCGAEKAESILGDFSLSKDEIDCVSNAIRNHEAFTPLEDASERQWVQLVSDCLYDADKFRWGSDTFTHTLWHMMDSQALSPREIIEKFPWGMSGTVRIMETFRTPTGRQFGPEIIETGMEIGKEIYRYLLQHYRE